MQWFSETMIRRLQPRLLPFFNCTDAICVKNHAVCVKKALSQIFSDYYNREILNNNFENCI